MGKRKGGTMMTTTGEMPIPASLAKRRRENMEQDRVARRKIISRTAIAQRHLDSLAAGADMTDVSDLPVITGLAPKKVPKKPPPRAPAAMAAVPDQGFLDRMQAPAKPPKSRVRPRVRQRDKGTPAPHMPAE